MLVQEVVTTIVEARNTAAFLLKELNWTIFHMYVHLNHV